MKTLSEDALHLQETLDVAQSEGLPTSLAIRALGWDAARLGRASRELKPNRKRTP